MPAKIKKRIKLDKSLTATGIVIIIMAVLLVAANIGIDIYLRNRAIDRMEEGINMIKDEITVKMERDSEILNATAKMLSKLENFDEATASQVMAANDVLMETMQVRILLPKDKVLTPDGMEHDVSQTSLSFEKEVELKEHISGRSTNVVTGTPILRHFVPIVRDETTVALLYGITELNELPDNLNNEIFFNGMASVYIIDTNNGDFILDTYPTHEGLGNIRDYNSSIYPRKTKGTLSWEDHIDAILAGKEGYVVFSTNATNGWDYMFYGSMGINDWAIAVEVPESVAFESVFFVREICLFFGLIMAGVIVVYYLWVRRNSKQTTQCAVEQAILTEKLQKAEAADRAKSAFLFNMSHDIRTPMNAIIGYTTLVRTCLDDRKKTEEYIDKILSSGNYMLSLVNDVLDMSRIESGKLNIEEKDCSVVEIFHDLRNIIMPRMRSKKLNYYMDAVGVIDEDICCDKLHVNQVLLNLLSNAIKFTPEGGSVWLTISQKETEAQGYGAYEIRVKDTGIGMSKDFIEHIFEPFERERNATASGVQGTGLGLAITKNIVDAMGGTITVESEQGKGTEFVIDLKFRLSSSPKKPKGNVQSSGLRVLVIDGSAATCDSVSKMLGMLGMTADCLSSGEKAVLRAKQARDAGDDYYAYIIDMSLDGLKVAREIREAVGESAPIIITSVYDKTDIGDEAGMECITAFCGKPVFLSELRDILILAAPNHDTSVEQEAVPDKSENVGEKRLLLVEDNELNREIAEELLSANGFIIDTAEDGRIAVEKVKNSPHGYYSLILMDIQMPIMNGYEATRAIRALDDKKFSSIPIVAMTANAFDEDKKQAFESGMNAHVAKPFDIDDLVKLINEIIRNKS